MKKSLKKPVLLFSLVVGMAAYAVKNTDQITVPYGDDSDASPVEDFGVMDNDSVDPMDGEAEERGYQPDNSEQIYGTENSEGDDATIPTDNLGESEDAGMNYGQPSDSENDSNSFEQNGDVEIGDEIEMNPGESSSSVSYQGAGDSDGEDESLTDDSESEDK